MNALKEVKDVVSPLGRGMFSLFGRNAERKKEAWFRRILKALTPGTQKAQQQSNGGGLFMGGGGGLLGSLLGTAGGSAAGGLMGGLLGRGKGLLKGGGKLLRRIPMLGALISGGMALGSMFGMDDDPTKTPDENRTQRYRGTGEAVGMGLGGLAGAAAGSLLGPIGTVVGGYLGAVLGGKVGGAVGVWTKSVVDSDIPTKVVAFVGAAWDSLSADLKKAWIDITTKAAEWFDAAKRGLDSVGQTLSDAGNAVNDWIKAKTGVDVKAGIGSAWEKTKQLAGEAASAMTPNTVKRAVAAGSAAAAQAKAGYDAARGTENTTPAPVGPLQRGARSVGGSLGDLIAKGEGGYGSFNRGVAGDACGATMDFSKMTVAEIMAAQALPKGDANRLFAVGKYQVIPSTMKGAAAAMGLTGKEQFTPELQERIFAEYLTDRKRPEIAGYIKGEHDNLSAAQRAGAREWASIADPTTGKSYYAGSARAPIIWDSRQTRE